ncbi:MAG: hypothetical protein ACI90A_001032 [Shewanella sp.]|jgi:hypothetical protein
MRLSVVITFILALAYHDDFYRFSDDSIGKE